MKGITRYSLVQKFEDVYSLSWYMQDIWRPWEHHCGRCKRESEPTYAYSDSENFTYPRINWFHVEP